MNSWRALWTEPRPSDVPVRVWRDWVLVGAYVVGVVVEAAVRSDVVWRPMVTVVALGMVPLLLFRRTHPLICVLAGFGMGAVLQVAQLVADVGEVGLDSMVVIIVLLYALVRWGSGREIVIGVPFVLAVAVCGTVAAYTGVSDAIGGAVFLFATIADGAAFRYRADVWRRQLAEIRSQERVGLARELHDTVAHHVSAIAVQAQAGQTLAAKRPGAALEALAVIEGEASRTLAEMRTMVRVLREGVAPEFSPQPGVADLSGLARTEGVPIVDVSVSGDLDHVSQPVDTALYRLAQESLTNALRHARHAARVTIRVVGEPDRVLLRVVDDGEIDPSQDATPGYGLLGMSERAQLLGGTLQAGPGPTGGWQVLAELPVGSAP